MSSQLTSSAIMTLNAEAAAMAEASKVDHTINPIAKDAFSQLHAHTYTHSSIMGHTSTSQDPNARSSLRGRGPNARPAIPERHRSRSPDRHDNDTRARRDRQSSREHYHKRKSTKVHHDRSTSSEPVSRRIRRKRPQDDPKDTAKRATDIDSLADDSAVIPSVEEDYVERLASPKAYERRRSDALAAMVKARKLRPDHVAEGLRKDALIDILVEDDAKAMFGHKYEDLTVKVLLAECSEREMPIRRQLRQRKVAPTRTLLVKELVLNDYDKTYVWNSKASKRKELRNPDAVEKYRETMREMKREKARDYRELKERVQRRRERC